MKLRTLLLTLLLMLVASNSFSQDFSDLDKVPLKGKNDFKSAEDKVLECAKYIISSPLDKEDSQLKSAENFVLNWMAGTPDYSFTLDDSLQPIMEKGPALLGVFMACYSQTAILDSHNLKSDDIFKKTMTSFIAYCKNPANKVELTEGVNKLIKQEENGKYKVM